MPNVKKKKTTGRNTDSSRKNQKTKTAGNKKTVRSSARQGKTPDKRTAGERSVNAGKRSAAADKRPAAERKTAEKRTVDRAAAERSRSKAAAGRTTNAKRKAAGQKPEKKAMTARQIARRQKRNKQMAVVITALILVVAALAYIYMSKRTYHGMTEIAKSEMEDIASTKYAPMGNKVLRYSGDGVALVNSKLEAIWSDIFTMSNPSADIKGDYAVIADIDGTTMGVYHKKNGYLSTINTPYNIIKARICADGLIAVILDGGDDTWINFYSSDGTLIADNQTKVQDPGFPMDIAVSDNGMIMMVAYQYIDGSDTSSYVAFYNFGEMGQSEDDRIVSGYHYERTVVPEIECMDGNHYVAIKDNGMTVYEGKQLPTEQTEIKIDTEIVSTFFDDDTFGIVYKNLGEDSEKSYTMDVYDLNGKKRFSKKFNIPYTNIQMRNNVIVLYNNSQAMIISSNGGEIYSGTVDGNINDLFRISGRKYVLSLDTGVSVVKLSGGR